MINLQVLGNIGNDAEVRATTTGMSAISFSVAHSESYTDKQGQKQSKTTWVRCTLWRKPESCNVADYLRKGTKILVWGEPSASAWTGQDGTVQSALELRVLNFEFAGSAPQQTQQQTQPANVHQPQPVKTQAAQAAAVNPLTTPYRDDDDLPF